MDRGLRQPLIESSHTYKTQELEDQGKRLNSSIATEVRGPFNRLLTLPKEGVGFSRTLYEQVESNAIDVSTPRYPKTLSAALGVCIAVIGTHTDADVGTFTILAHLLPTGHMDRDIKPVSTGNHCVTEQFMRWAALANLGDNAQRKEVYLRSILSIFHGGEWDMTIVTPVVGEGDPPHWISHVDVAKHLERSLGYDENAIALEISNNAKVEPNGRIKTKRPTQ